MTLVRHSVSFWNLVGGIGFTLCGAMGYNQDEKWVNNSAISTFWGEFGSWESRARASRLMRRTTIQGLVRFLSVALRRCTKRCGGNRKLRTCSARQMSQNHHMAGTFSEYIRQRPYPATHETDLRNIFRVPCLRSHRSTIAESVKQVLVAQPSL